MTKWRENAILGVRMKKKTLINNLIFFRDNHISVKPEELDIIIQELLEFDELKRVIHDTVDTAIELYSFLFSVTGEFK